MKILIEKTGPPKIDTIVEYSFRPYLVAVVENSESCLVFHILLVEQH